MTTILPLGWMELSDQDDEVINCYQKTYPDGLDVLLTIEHKDSGYELWSSAETRCSGPVKNKDSVHQSVESARKAALAEMIQWDNE
ncbi:hypothetical protein [Celerinatantimonas sp. MCCC 1A17872]|uniref:hypothetical protein n=1 Tax=Celerinatantimonas sp. MCCC 1A17872 TaxID=3177514 RepID=UPI0038C68EC0